MATITNDEVFAKFQGASIDRDNIEYFRGTLQRKLLINRCQECGYWIFPHRPMCPQCWSEKVVPTEVSGKGEVYMFTISHQSPGVTREEPYLAGTVELAEQKGLRYMAPIVNCRNEDIQIGTPMELTWTERMGAPAPAWQRATK